jgi:hypothetical protein
MTAQPDVYSCLYNQTYDTSGLSLWFSRHLPVSTYQSRTFFRCRECNRNSNWTYQYGEFSRPESSTFSKPGSCEQAKFAFASSSYCEYTQKGYFRSFFKHENLRVSRHIYDTAKQANFRVRTNTKVQTVRTRNCSLFRIYCSGEQSIPRQHFPNTLKYNNTRSMIIPITRV